MPDPITNTTWRPTIGRRILVLAAVFIVWTATIEARLVYLQVFKRVDMQREADGQRNSRVPIPANRGEILDRQGNLLAYSVDADSVCAYPIRIKDPAATLAALCAALNGCSPDERATLTADLGSKKKFLAVRHFISPDEARRISALKLQGIGLIKESRRVYPNETLAAQVLGYVGREKGLAGIESAYELKIHGKDGTAFVQVDAQRDAYSRLEQPPIAGATLELTIDRSLQYVVERELHAGIVENRAQSGTALIMDPRTGEILALASEPTFDPNQIVTALERGKGVGDPEPQRNRAVQDLYEPGSTFKVVTASAAFEEGVESPTDLVDVSAGQIQLGKRIVPDSHRINSVISFTDVLVKSSNVGAIRVGLKLGGERLSRYVHLFGFGARASVDFPSENPGHVSRAAHWSDSHVASVSMGYEVGVTPLQMATAVSSIANGGELVQPHVVRAFIEEGHRSEVARRVVRRTVSQSTASTLTGIMEQVVERGTGTEAKIPGYSIAAKTGTAQRLIAGHYSHTEFNASFVGFLPARDPVVTILVLINSPHAHGYYGGVVAAPIFRRIAEATLTRLGIPPTVGGAAPVLVVAPRPTAPGPPPGVPRPTVAVVTASRVAETPGLVPDVVGLSARSAALAVVRLGLVPVLQGDGIVVGQNPPAGTSLDLGAACHLSLARPPSPGNSRQ